MMHRFMTSRTWCAAPWAAMAAVLALAASAAARPDIELGRYLASECLTCHRGATATSTIPNIFGMAEPRFTTLIKAYREKQLPNPVMQNVASRLKDEDIEALAAYFAATKRP
jgi:cytochrome c